jgi:hypothetical protein
MRIKENDNAGWLRRFVRRLVANANLPTNNPGTGSRLLCADCGQPVENVSGPKDGWQLEDGRTVCHVCCVADTRRIVREIIKLKSPNEKS